MTPVAITMMIIAVLTIGGGFSLALWNLARHPEEDEQLPEDLPHER